MGERPIKRRVRFSEEFEPPSSGLRRTPFRVTPILRAPPPRTNPITGACSSQNVAVPFRAGPSRAGPSRVSHPDDAQLSRTLPSSGDAGPSRTLPTNVAALSSHSNVSTTATAPTRVLTSNNGASSTTPTTPNTSDIITLQQNKQSTSENRLVTSQIPNSSACAARDERLPITRRSELTSSLYHKPFVLTPDYGVGRVGPLPGSMAYRTPPHRSCLRSRQATEQTPKYFPFTPREVSPWQRQSRFFPDVSPVTPDEQESPISTISAPVRPPARRKIRKQSRSTTHNESPPAVILENGSTSNRNLFDYVPKRVLFAIFSAFFLVFYGTVTVFTPILAKEHHKLPHCAVYNAYKYYDGWSVLVRRLDSGPSSMWLENDSPYVSNLKNGCSSYKECGETEFPCYETRRGTLFAIESDNRERDSILGCLQFLFSCFTRLIGTLIGVLVTLFVGYLAWLYMSSFTRGEGILE